MTKLIASVISIKITVLVIGTIFLSSVGLHAEQINVKATIRDSLSHDSIPVVKVTIVNLGKSFMTTKSSFYGPLPADTHDFLLEADGYNPLRKSVILSQTNSVLIFEMLKRGDDVGMRAKKDTLKQYIGSFNEAIKNRDVDEAERLIVLLEQYDCSSSTLEKAREAIEITKISLVDSLMGHARELEEAQKYADAYYYYKKIVEMDSLNQIALDKVDEMDKKLKGKQKPTTTTTPTTTPVKPKVTGEEITKMYNDGVARFLAEDYKGALKLFQSVLKYDSTHEGAQKYLDRTKARIKALGG